VLAFIGATGGVANVVAVTFLQMRAEEHMRGRVMSVVMFNAVGLTPFSFAIAGALVEVSLRGLFCGAGALVLLLTLYVALRTSLSELD
jgi:MFS family permease